MAPTQESAAHPSRAPGAYRRLGATDVWPARVLLVVDGTEGTGRAIDYLLGLATGRPDLKAVLLNIQPRPAEGRLRGYGSFKQRQIHDRLINELGGRAVAAVGKRLDQAGVEHKDRVELGEASATILRVASAEGCDLIVMGETRPGTARQWLTHASGMVIGSLAGQVAALARVPVLVVK